MKLLQNTILAIMFIFIGQTIERIRIKSNQPEYKIDLLNQTEIRIESTSTKVIDTIQFEDINQWIDKDNL